jgi:hypothetical protein
MHLLHEKNISFWNCFIWPFCKKSNTAQIQTKWHKQIHQFPNLSWLTTKENKVCFLTSCSYNNFLCYTYRNLNIWTNSGFSGIEYLKSAIGPVLRKFVSSQYNFNIQPWVVYKEVVPNSAGREVTKEVLPFYTPFHWTFWKFRWDFFWHSSFMKIF